MPLFKFSSGKRKATSNKSLKNENKYCNKINDALKLSKWLQGDLCKSSSLVLKSIKIFQEHRESNCNCIANGSNMLLLACDYYQLFLVYLKKFNSLIEKEEAKLEIKSSDKNKLVESDEIRLTSPSTCGNKKPSKYDSHAFSYYVNFASQNSLLKPLKQCIKYFKETFSQDEPDVQVKLIQGLQINSILISCYYIFSCYHLFDFQYTCAKILIDINMRVMPEEKETLVTAYHFMIKLFLEYGAIGKAHRYLKLAQALLKVMKKKNFETFESALIYLDKCEIDLKLGKVKRSCENIKIFLNSDYLNRLTLNRYFLKGLALIFASKLPASHYSYTANFQEFMEPVQIAVCILKRWHRPHFASSPSTVTKEIIENIDIDPIWYRFAVYEFAITAFPIANTFYLNIGFPLDIITIYNGFIKIIRQNCFLNSLLKFLMIGAKVDSICSKNEWSWLKLKEALSCIDSKHIPKLGNSSSVLKSDMDEKISIDFLSSPIKGNNNLDNSLFKEIVIEDSTSTLSSQPMPDQEYNCSHQNPKSLYDIKRTLQGQDDSDSMEETFVNLASLRIPNYESYIFPANILILELFIQLSNAQSDENFEMESKFKDVLANLPNFFSSIAKSIGNAFQIDFKKIHIVNFIPIFLFKMKILDLLSEKSTERKDWSSTIDILGPFIFSIDSPLFNFETQSLFGQLLFKYINAKVKSNKLESLILEYDSLSIEEKLSSSRAALPYRTPSPVSKKGTKLLKTKRLQKVPNAPKGRIKYKMEEFKDYVEGLSKNLDKPKNVSLKMNNFVSYDSDESISSDQNNLHQIFDPNVKMSTNNLKKNQNIIKPLEVKFRNEINSKDQVDELTKSLKNNLIIDKDMENDLNQLLDLKLIDEIKKEKKEAEKIVEHFIHILKLLLELYDNHPPCYLYSQIHRLIFELYSCSKSTNWDAATYHLSESVSANSLRYRGLFTSERKKNVKLRMKLETNLMLFQSKRDLNHENMNYLMEKVSKNWRIVQLFSLSNGPNLIPDLFISRVQKGKKSIFLKIKGNSNKFTQNFMDELFEIIELSNASIVNKEAQSFWKARYALNSRFNILLNSVENAWLGPFKGIFLGQFEDVKFANLCDQLKMIIMDNIGKKNCQDESLLDMVIESFPILAKEQITSALALIFNEFDVKILSDCYLECHEAFNILYPNVEKLTIFNDILLNQVSLIMNQGLELFPFESLPSLSYIKQEFFRVPSIRFLSILLKTFDHHESIYRTNVQQNETYYVINPADNLSKTEERFKKKFLKKNDWKGVIGVPPKAQELKKCLESKDLYIFFGHGAGSSYYRTIPEGLEGTSIRTVALVIGCCSGKLMTDGKNCDSYGMPYKFILNGCPSYVGVLWDVTDRDIDRFSDKLLSNWMLDWEYEDETSSNNKYSSLCKSVVMSRNVCKLIYLIGAAPVVYGLPVSMKSKKNE